MRPRMVPLIIGSASLIANCFTWMSGKIKKTKGPVNPVSEVESSGTQ